MKEIKILTDIIKLDSFLKFAGKVSCGAQAKEFIKKGLVSVNNEKCFSRGKKLKPGDCVVCDSEVYTVTN